jgi:hypothetical protein
MAAPKRMAANASKALERSYDFFRKHAGFVVGKSAQGAWKLARAELEAASRGWYCEWEDDPDGFDTLGEIPPEEVEEVLIAVLYDENGEMLASLGGIVNPDRNYARVVEAELAVDALAEFGQI